MANLDTGCGTVSLAKSSSHSGLKSISTWKKVIRISLHSYYFSSKIITGTAQHFVDSEDVEGMDSNSDVETILAAVLDEVLVATNTPGLQSLGGQLLEFVRNQVDAQGELVDSSLLTSEIKDPDLGVWDTTVESALGIGLVLAVAIALGWSPTHLL